MTIEVLHEKRGLWMIEFIRVKKHVENLKHVCFTSGTNGDAEEIAEDTLKIIKGANLVKLWYLKQTDGDYIQLHNLDIDRFDLVMTAKYNFDWHVEDWKATGRPDPRFEPSVDAREPRKETRVARQEQRGVKSDTREPRERRVANPETRQMEGNERTEARSERPNDQNRVRD